MSTDRGDRRRRQIIDAALAEIRAQPVADVQLSAIAARAGVGPSHALYYFGSRDGVLVAAVAHAEQELAAGRRERLQSIEDPEERLAAFVEAYLPDDRHDPVWKLWFEGWLRSTSRSEFADVGIKADQAWHEDLVACAGLSATDARRMLFFLDGLAVHVLADHITAGEAREHAISGASSARRSGSGASP